MKSIDRPCWSMEIFWVAEKNQINSNMFKKITKNLTILIPLKIKFDLKSIFAGISKQMEKARWTTLYVFKILIRSSTFNPKSKIRPRFNEIKMEQIIPTLTHAEYYHYQRRFTSWNCEYKLRKLTCIPHVIHHRIKELPEGVIKAACLTGRVRRSLAIYVCSKRSVSEVK